MPVPVEQASCLFLEDRRDACPTGGNFWRTGETPVLRGGISGGQARR
ncbi:MAG: hypothetical protein SXA11_00485 [Cyanobacteriota bacterium]|nr:hypothetical protein [Cyanobacteriota bacterium]